jgi:hypothetical protein
MKGVCFMDLKHHFEIANNTWIVNLSGEIDIYNAPQLKEQLLKLLEEQKGNMLIDCKDLKYIIICRLLNVFFRGVAQFGSARALGAWGRGFKSLHPDHICFMTPWSSG